jgi:FkbM family methyltransferase
MDRSMQEKLNENQIYVGINPIELHVLDQFADPSAAPREGFYTDFSGVKTRLSYFGLPSGKLDAAVGSIPFPDDGVHAEAIEYLAAIRAVRAAKNSFTAVELGAGYAPWLTFSAKAAQRIGIENISILGVEADLERHALIRSHLGDNGLPVPGASGEAAAGRIKSKIIHGAVSDTNGTVTFGSQNIHDWGAAPIENGGNVDFRGLKTDAVPVNAYTIDRVISDLDTVDFMHIDIQGFEYKSIKASLDAIRKKVRFLLIATHSRKIEGELFSLLYGNGWHILHEKPCKFRLHDNDSLEALTYVDGTQVWVNKDLVTPSEYEIDETVLRLKVAEYRSSALEEVVKEKENIIWTLESENARIRDELSRIKKSISWRITQPLRRAK